MIVYRISDGSAEKKHSTLHKYILEFYIIGIILLSLSILSHPNGFDELISHLQIPESPFIARLFAQLALAFIASSIFLLIIKDNRIPFRIMHFIIFVALISLEVPALDTNIGNYDFLLHIIGGTLAINGSWILILLHIIYLKPRYFRGLLLFHCLIFLSELLQVIFYPVPEPIASYLQKIIVFEVFISELFILILDYK